MRTALVYNFLIESTLIASVGIVLMMMARKLLGKPLGSRALMFGWALVAIRLLCPLVLPNPLINRIRSPFAADAAIRPIAGQVQVRLRDLLGDAARHLGRRGLPFAALFDRLREGMYSGTLARSVFILWLMGMACVLAWFIVRWIRKKGQWKQELLMALCCAVHWFNPLVWLARRMMRADALLAKAQPKERRPLGIAFAATASVLLLFAFATGEHVPSLATDAALPSALPAFPSNPDDDSLIAYAEALYALPGFETDTADASWEIDRLVSGYLIRMEKGETISSLLNLLPDGRVNYYAYYDTAHEQDGYMGFERRASDELSHQLSGYALALTDRVLPGVSGWIEAFEPGLRQDLYPSGYEGAISGVTYISQNAAAPGVYLRMQVEPETRIRAFWVDAAILQSLWKNGLEPLPSQLPYRLGAFPVQQSAPAAPEGLLCAEDALDKALSHIRENYGETDASLRRYELRCTLNTEGEPHLWEFRFDGPCMDGYSIDVDAKTGSIVQCYGPNEGNG